MTTKLGGLPREWHNGNPPCSSIYYAKIAQYGYLEAYFSDDGWWSVTRSPRQINVTRWAFHPSYRKEGVKR